MGTLTEIGSVITLVQEEGGALQGTCKIIDWAKVEKVGQQHNVQNLHKTATLILGSVDSTE